MITNQADYSIAGNSRNQTSIFNTPKDQIPMQYNIFTDKIYPNKIKKKPVFNKLSKGSRASF